MRQFDLIYDPDENEEILLLNNIDIQKLSAPITIQREDPIQEEEQPFSKKKSEVIEYENEDYIALKEVEQDPWNIIDAESKAYTGKLQDMSNNASSMYFAFINMGSFLKVVHINKWYGFVQKNIFLEGDPDVLEAKLQQFEVFDDDEENDYEENLADFEQEFDDDDGEEVDIYIEKEKKLTTSGQQLKGIVDNYENDYKEKNISESAENEEVQSEGSKAKHIKIDNKLSIAEIKKAFGSGLISVKDLLQILSIDRKLDEKDKVLIRDFIKENCKFEIDPKTGEKMFKLKK